MIAPLTLLELGKFAEIAYQQTGIRIMPNKLELLNNRLGRRLRDLHLDSYRKYLRYLRENLAVELCSFIQAITTNETYFFRYPLHFYLLSKEIFPNFNNKDITIWSAACSSGEEAYSLAIAAQERLPRFFNRNVTIYASDIDIGVLKKAHEGMYNSYSLRNVRKDHLNKYFYHINNEHYKITPGLRDKISLGLHNLKQRFPKGKVDIVFCRNVLIYFDNQSKNQVIDNLINTLKPGGYLFLGESEIVPDKSNLVRMKSSVAQKVK